MTENRKLLSIGAFGIILVLFIVNTVILLRPESQPQAEPSVHEETRAEPEQAAPEQQLQENKKLIAQEPREEEQQAYAYVLNQRDNTLSKVNLATQRVIITIAVSPRPSDAVIANDRLYVASTDASVITVIDLKAHAVIETIELENSPEALAFYENKLFVTDSKEDAVRVIDLASKRITKILVGEKPRAIALEPEKGFLFVANFESDDITVINPRINVALDDVDLTGKGPISLAISPLKDYIYVVNELTNDASILPYKFVKKLQREVNRIQVGSRPLRIALTPDGQYALVTNFYGDSIAVISTRQQRSIATINVGSSPYAIAVNEEGTRAYVTEYTTGTLAVIDLKTFKKIDEIKVGEGPVKVLLYPNSQVTA